MNIIDSIERTLNSIQLELCFLNNSLNEAIENKNKELIKELKANIKSKESDIKRLSKALEKEKKLELETELLSVKEFFNYIFSNCSFDSVMKNYTDLFDDKSKAEFVIIPLNNELIIRPLNEDELFMKTFIRIKMNQHSTTKFSKWIIDTNKPVKFSLGDFSLFRKIVLNPGKSGLKILVNKVNATNYKFTSSGAFYNAGNLDIEWEHSFETIEYELEDNFLEYLNDENDIDLDLDSPSNIRYENDNETIIEMSEDMIDIWQKTTGTSYYLRYSDIMDSEFSTVMLYSVNEGASFFIYQIMNVIRF